MKAAKIDLPTLQTENIALDNGIPLYCFTNLEMSVVRLEFLFQSAGKANQQKLFLAAITNSLITEGTQEHTALEIANVIDYYGAFVEKVVNQHSCSIVFFFMEKYWQDLLPYIEQIILCPIFEEQQFEVCLKQNKQLLQQNLQKTSFVASNKFFETAFGATHPYGKCGKVEDFDMIDRNDITSFHNKHYNLGKAKIIASGAITKSLITELNARFGKIKLNNVLTDAALPITNVAANKIAVDMDSTQTSLRIGKQTIAHTNKDFIALNILNTILGGYFGSRLIANIREKRGLTYGINSSIAAYPDVSVFYIACDVKLSSYRQAIGEIMGEIGRLSDTLIDDSELNVAKNYIKGDIIRALDGVIELSERFSFMTSRGIGIDYYNRYMNELNTITPEQLRETARLYLQRESLSTIVVGKNALI
jgi:predicted Zn-dependent peptidase